MDCLNDPDTHEYRIYADDRGHIYAVVDREDNLNVFGLHSRAPELTL